MQTDDLFSLDPHHSAEKPIVLRLRCISNHSKLFLDTMCDPKLIDILSDLVRFNMNTENVAQFLPLRKTLNQYHVCKYSYRIVSYCIFISTKTAFNKVLPPLPMGGWGVGVLPIMDYRGGSTQNSYLFQAEGT